MQRFAGDRSLQLVSWDSVQADFGGMNGSVLEGDDYLLMERQFAAGITVEGANSLPGPRFHGQLGWRR